MNHSIVLVNHSMKDSILIKAKSSTIILLPSDVTMQNPKTTHTIWNLFERDGYQGKIWIT